MLNEVSSANEAKPALICAVLSASEGTRITETLHFVQGGRKPPSRTASRERGRYRTRDSRSAPPVASNPASFLLPHCWEFITNLLRASILKQF